MPSSYCVERQRDAESHRKQHPLRAAYIIIIVYYLFLEMFQGDNGSVLIEESKFFPKTDLMKLKKKKRLSRELESRLECISHSSER